MNKSLRALSIVILFSALCGAENLPIVDQNGMQTGYHVQTNENQVQNVASMVQASQAIGQSQANASLAAGLSNSIMAAEVGYLQGSEYRRAEDLNEALIKRLESDTAAAANGVLVPQRTVDAWVYAEAEMTARLNNILKGICAKNPKDPRCSQEAIDGIPEMINAALLNNDLILVSKASYYKTPKRK